MKIALYTPVISPHQMPLAKAIVGLLGQDNFRYIHWKELTAERKSMGWFDGGVPSWVIAAETDEANAWMRDADVVLFTGWSNLEVLERRAATGRLTYYVTERWFKPPVGWLRLLLPQYIRIAVRIGRMIRSRQITVLPIGIPAARELAALYAHRAVRNVSQKPLEVVDGVEWMRLWGYCVSPAEGRQGQSQKGSGPLRVLWVGRFLWLKRVDTLIRAVYAAANASCPIELTLVGDGVAKQRMMDLDARLSKSYGIASPVTFKPSMPIAQIRSCMREHDAYVLASNGYEGWGAVVSEALEEGLEVFGTEEAGASNTVLPKENLFKAGDWRGLSALLARYASSREGRCHGIGPWSAAAMAKMLTDVSGNRECLSSKVMNEGQ